MIYPESPLPVRIKIILSFLIAIFKISASPVYTSVSEDYKHQNTTNTELSPFDCSSSQWKRKACLDVVKEERISSFQQVMFGPSSTLKRY